MTTLLIVEDDADLRSSIAEILMEEGFDTLEAENGLEGVQLAQTHKPDLIICDIMMPKMDGYSVLLQLRENPSTAMIPFIFLTALTERVKMRQGMELGADDFMTKPFEPEELLKAINTRLERQAMLVKDSDRRLDELRGRLIHTLPHEFRTPLTSILGYSDVILMGGDSIEPQNLMMMVETIFQAGHRLQHLIENYLLYAQIEMNHSDPERIKTFRQHVVENPASVIEQVILKEARKVGRVDDLDVSLENAPICMSEDYLQRIVRELVDNALKFSKGGSSVEVTSTISKRHYVFQIRDYGHGMTPAEIKEVGLYIQFERKLYEHQGLGLGLIIAKRIAELYGGHLEIESIKNKQTTVTVTLPLA